MFRIRLYALLALALVPALTVMLVPPIDLAVTGWFYSDGDFPWRVGGLAEFLHDLVKPVSLAVGGLLVLMTLTTVWRRTGWRRWAFLLLTLLVGPWLVTNVVFKDNWGRARPMQVEQFGGTAQFTPAFVITDQCRNNCSFVSGDASFGFWLHSFAYIAPRRRRALFWTGIGAGVGLGLVRIGMGAHFLSDVLFAGIFTVAVSAALYATLFSRQALGLMWREFLGTAHPGGGRVVRPPVV